MIPDHVRDKPFSAKWYPPRIKSGAGIRRSMLYRVRLTKSTPATDAGSGIEHPRRPAAGNSRSRFSREDHDSGRPSRQYWFGFDHGADATRDGRRWA
jgi:hypothetical protein